jgi:hypothetical protein
MIFLSNVSASPHHYIYDLQSKCMHLWRPIYLKLAISLSQQRNDGKLKMQ